MRDSDLNFISNEYKIKCKLVKRGKYGEFEFE
jgi:hypothetical protein